MRQKTGMGKQMVSRAHLQICEKTTLVYSLVRGFVGCDGSGSSYDIS